MSARRFLPRLDRLGGKPGLERGQSLGEPLLLLARLGRHGLDRLELLATHQFHAVEDVLELFAEPRLDLLPHARERAQRARRHARQILESPVVILHASLSWPISANDIMPIAARRQYDRRRTNRALRSGGKAL